MGRTRLAIVALASVLALHWAALTPVEASSAQQAVGNRYIQAEEAVPLSHIIKASKEQQALEARRKAAALAASRDRLERRKATSATAGKRAWKDPVAAYAEMREAAEQETLLTKLSNKAQEALGMSAHRKGVHRSSSGSDSDAKRRNKSPMSSEEQIKRIEKRLKHSLSQKARAEGDKRGTLATLWDAAKQVKSIVSGVPMEPEPVATEDIDWEELERAVGEGTGPGDESLPQMHARLEAAAAAAALQSGSEKQAAGTDHHGRALGDSECSNVGLVVGSVDITFECNGVAVTEPFYNAVLATQAANIANTTAPDFTNATQALCDAASAALNVSVCANLTIDGSGAGAGATNALQTALDNLNCTKISTDVVRCACPLDYYGVKCEKQLRASCGISVKDDEYNACVRSDAVTSDLSLGPLGYNTLLDGDPPCLAVSRAGALDLEFHASCSFNTQAAYTAPAGTAAAQQTAYSPGTGSGAAAVVYRCNGTVITDAFMNDLLGNAEANRRRNDTSYDGFYGMPCLEASFTYPIMRKDGAFLSSQPLVMSLSLLPRDYSRISDTTYAVLQSVAHDALAGTQTQVASLDVSALPDRFFAGGRLYLDAGLNRVSAGSNVQFGASSYMTIVGDVVGYQQPPPDDSIDVAAVVAVVLVVLVLLAFGGFLMYWYYIREEPLDDELQARKAKKA